MVLDSEESEASDKFDSEMEDLDTTNPYRKINQLFRVSKKIGKFLKKSANSDVDKRLMKGVFTKEKGVMKYKKRDRNALAKEIISYWGNQGRFKGKQERKNSMKD